ncbi:TPA: protelomerase family protein [Citrobacter freundii]
MAKLGDGGIGKIISDLVADVDAIEASDIPQGDKTRKYKAAATRVKNALFLDKRKFRGNGLKKRITANTYNAYMTRIRKQFDDRLHHHFTSSIEKLAAKYPAYSAELQAWQSMPAADIRQAYGNLQGQLKEIMPLAEVLSGMKFGPAAEKKLTRLAKKYPAWSIYLNALTSQDWKSVETEMHAAFQQGTRLLDDLNGLKINHEILYHLQLSPAERSSIQQRWGEVLSEKKRSTVLLDYPKYMQAVTEQIYKAFEPSLITQRKDMAPLAFALAAVSGRRLIEVMVQGEFEVTGKYEVIFYGQAKKRTGEDKGRKIYVLCDPALFVQRLNELRSCPAAADFDEIRSLLNDDSYRAANVRIASILGNTFNQHAKLFFGDDRRTFKDTRAIYARITYEAFFRYDPRWKNVDEDVFFSEILGHDDENTQLHYKQFKLHNFSRSWRPETGIENKRLAALQALDDQMPGFARGDAGIRIHETTKRLVEESADIVINTKILRDAGFNPTLVRRYLDFVAEALAMGASVPDADTPSIVINADELDEDTLTGDSGTGDGETGGDAQELEADVVESDSATTTEDEKHTAQSDDRPRFSAPIRNNDGGWAIRFEYKGQRYAWSGQAESIGEAMRAAWNAYFQ